METMNFKVRKNEFKSFVPSREGIVIELDGEGIIGIVPSSNSESFLVLDKIGGSTNVVSNEGYAFEIPKTEEVGIEFKVNLGLEITTYNEENKQSRSYFIPVKSDWVVEFRNRRVCGKTVIQGDSVWLHLKK